MCVSVSCIYDVVELTWLRFPRSTWSVVSPDFAKEKKQNQNKDAKLLSDWSRLQCQHRKQRDEHQNTFNVCNFATFVGANVFAARLTVTGVFYL